MIIISHRGNIKGSVLDKENRPSYIDCAIQLGYEVEIDIRYIDNQFWIGHDVPQYLVNVEWINSRKSKLWLHCKNREAAIALSLLNDSYKYFCHEMENYVLTSTNHLWVHDVNGYVDNMCIIPLITDKDIEHYKNKIPYAVCTDYVNVCLEKKFIYG